MPVDKSESRIRRMFGEISPRYDFLNHFLSGGADYYWRWRAVRAVPPRDEAPILDVCTGTGDLAIAYAKNSRGSASVIGTDFAHGMLTRAASKADRKVPGNGRCSPIAFLEADTQQLPFADDRFQIVTVAFGLRNVTDTGAGLGEMIRVCQPGGRVVVLEFSMPGNRVLRGLYSWYFRHVLPRIGQLLASNRESAYNYLPESVSEFPYGEALADIMRGCGLGQVTWKPLTFGIATLYVGTKA
jgi:demethylmenaquinone methyltransferase/2-methoxy-6-polyprenyl-1,4-benzoquinol methylase